MPPHDFIDTAERLVRLETKLDVLLQTNPQIALKFDALEKRITALEKWHNTTIGALFAVNIFLVFFADNIKGLF